jgi:hypothetical protein
MIALPNELPLVEWHNRKNVPLSEGWLAESIATSVERAGLSEWRWTYDVTKAISYFLQTEYKGTLISASDLKLILRKSLTRIGYPELAQEVTLVAPRVTVYLHDIAREALYELSFFAELNDRLEEARRTVVRGVRLEGIRPAVKILTHSGKWNGACEELADEIVRFARNKIAWQCSVSLDLMIC